MSGSGQQTVPTRLANVAPPSIVRQNQKRRDFPADYEPGGTDVLCGRGKSNWNHEGNVNFRDFIRQNVTRYVEAPTKNDKTAIVVQLVDEMRQRGCHFLRQDSAGTWYDIGDAQARDKVGHGLRDQVTAMNRQNKFKEARADASAAAAAAAAVGQHRRVPSIALSDGGNEAEQRRESLHTSEMFRSFARRPSWVADSLTDIFAELGTDDLAGGVGDGAAANLAPGPRKRTASNDLPGVHESFRAQQRSRMGSVDRMSKGGGVPPDRFDAMMKSSSSTTMDSSPSSSKRGGMTMPNIPERPHTGSAGSMEAFMDGLEELVGPYMAGPDALPPPEAGVVPEREVSLSSSIRAFEILLSSGTTNSSSSGGAARARTSSATRLAGRSSLRIPSNNSLRLSNITMLTDLDFGDSSMLVSDRTVDRQIFDYDDLPDATESWGV
jgi:hypothetical protein